MTTRNVTVVNYTFWNLLVQIKLLIKKIFIYLNSVKLIKFNLTRFLVFISFYLFIYFFDFRGKMSERNIYLLLP